MIAVAVIFAVLLGAITFAWLWMIPAPALASLACCPPADVPAGSTVTVTSWDRSQEFVVVGGTPLTLDVMYQPPHPIRLAIAGCWREIRLDIAQATFGEFGWPQLIFWISIGLLLSALFRVL